MSMRSLFFALLLCLYVVALAADSKPGSGRWRAGSAVIRVLTPGDVNVRIETDVRTFVVMAALNAAGFDNERGRTSLSPARVELLKTAKLDPKLKENWRLSTSRTPPWS